MPADDPQSQRSGRHLKSFAPEPRKRQTGFHGNVIPRALALEPQRKAAQPWEEQYQQKEGLCPETTYDAPLA